MAKGMSEREFAKHSGRALSTVQQARASGRLSRSVSKDTKGRIRIDPVLAAEEWLENTQPRITEGAVQAWRAARARLAEAQAAAAEDDLKRTRGLWVDAGKMQATIIDVFTRCRTKLAGIPTRAKQQLPHLGTQDVAAVDALIREALEQLADALEAEGRLHVNK